MPGTISCTMLGTATETISCSVVGIIFRFRMGLDVIVSKGGDVDRLDHLVAHHRPHGLPDDRCAGLTMSMAEATATHFAEMAKRVPSADRGRDPGELAST